MNLSLFMQRLEEARKNQGMTVKVLAEACGVSESTMTRYTKATVLPPLDIACNMAKKLGVSLDWLTGNSTSHDRMRIRTAGDLLRVLFELLTTASVDIAEHIEDNGFFQETIPSHIATAAYFDAESSDIRISASRMPPQAKQAFLQMERLVSLYHESEPFMKEFVIAGIMKYAEQADVATLPVKVDS